ncbi:hypothetical protein L21_2669 [Methanoculleus chikugoensis]|uniref:Uncharacterized protein n=2 Tax=Methanoculleus chikugoensis TaxID=118126 RepID=A0A1M4MPE2_9EURY|nr:hypothetical protein L21_2669 [Methanoculleus chikugoensis]
MEECSHNMRKFNIVCTRIIVIFVLVTLIALFSWVNFISPVGFVIVSLIVFLCMFTQVWYYFQRAFETKEIINSKPGLNNNVNHHAIIIAHSKGVIEETYFLSKFRSASDYMDGIDILVNCFVNHKPPIPYKIYEVTTKEEALIPIKSSNTSHIWIFGHGQRNFLNFKGGGLCYPKIKNVPEKVFVGQYHCNSILGTSLAEITKAKAWDVTRLPRITPCIRISVSKKLKQLVQSNLLMPDVGDDTCV